MGMALFFALCGTGRNQWGRGYRRRIVPERRIWILLPPGMQSIAGWRGCGTENFQGGKDLIDSERGEGYDKENIS